MDRQDIGGIVRLSMTSEEFDDLLDLANTVMIGQHNLNNLPVNEFAALTSLCAMKHVRASEL